MTDQVDSSETDTRRLVVAIIDFLREQLLVRTDFVPEDRDCLQIAMECLETAFDLEGNGQIQYRSNRPLMDIYNQVINPVSVKDKLRAESHKEEGNNYMRGRMFVNAENEYTNAIKLDKWNAIYYANRASARIEQRNYFEAIADCRHALGLNPDYAKAHSRMGQAYALIDRRREAERCFRQALELEPDNERYQNNLRVAESQINTSGIEEFITALLLGSLFGQGSRNAVRSSSRTMPPSFMIIAESHPPVPDRPPQTAQRPQIDESSRIPRNSLETVNGTHATESHVSSYNGIEKQPLQPYESCTRNRYDEEFVINIPLFEFDVILGTERSQADSDLQNAQNLDERPAKNLQNIHLDKDKDKITDAERRELNEDNTTCGSFFQEFVNRITDAGTSQSTKYFPSGPEYIYHPRIKNDVKEDTKCKNASASGKDEENDGKDKEHDGKHNANAKKNENRKKGEPSK